MPSNYDLIASNKALLIAKKNKDNQRWMDLLIKLEITQTNVLNRYLSSFNYDLSDHSSWSAHYAGSAEPEFIELLKALIKLKNSHPETSNTLLSDLINNFITESIQLAAEIIPKKSNHFLDTRKGNLIKLTDTVNNVTSLVTTIRRGADTKDAVADIVNSAEELQYSLAGSLFRRSTVIGSVVSAAICLVAVAMFATPFLVGSLLPAAALVSGLQLVGFLLSSVFAVFGGLPVMVGSYMYLESTLESTEQNYFLNKTKNSAKSFTQNTQTLFTTKLLIKTANIEMTELHPANRVA